MKQHREERRAEHAKVMHDALNVRPDQEAAFQAMIASMDGGPGEHMHHGMGHDGMAGGGDHRLRAAPMRAGRRPPERLDRMEKRMAERTEAFQRHAQAVKAFYAVLSPEQQRTFDALMKIRGHGGGHGMGGRHHGMGGPEPAVPATTQG